MADASAREGIRVLLVTSDATLRESRRAVLESFGHHVTASETREEAADLIKATPIDVLLLGQVLTPQECFALGMAYRQIHPEGRIVQVIGAKSYVYPDSDATVDGLAGPKALNQAILSCLKSR